MNSTNFVRVCVLLAVSLGVGAISGCDNNPPANNPSSPTTPATSGAATPAPQDPAKTTAPSAPSAPVGPGAATTLRPKSGATGTLTANPNPIQVCDGSGLGVTTLSWTFSGATLAQVRIASPSGGLLAAGGSPGSKATGKWVGGGTTFYLQDVSNGLPATPENTIATVSVNVTTQGCPR
jgi:hypothetical protein